MCSLTTQMYFNGSSEGEYSDELSISSESPPSNFAESPFDISENIKDISVGANDILSDLPPLDDRDYNLSKPTAYTGGSDISVREIDSVVFVASKIDAEIESDRVAGEQRIISWINVKSKHSSHGYLSQQIENVKKKYSELSTDLNFIGYAEPSKSKLDELATIRNDIGKNRILFHFFGNELTYGEGNSELLMDGYPMEKVFSAIVPPSFFVFDCGNSGAAIEYIKKVAEKNKNMPRRKKGRCELRFSEMSANWDDWMCFCSCDKDKQVPVNPLLPIDFLGSCLLTPVTISILLHILQFYRCSFPDEQFPLKYLSSVLMYDNSSSLESLLSLLVSSIAVDYLPLDTFFQLFKMDPLVSMLFERFILFQYLLKQYTIVPLSYPEIPNMSRHSFWLHWQLAIDNTLNNILIPTPSFSNDFFQQAFSVFILHQKEKSSSLLPISYVHVITKYLIDKHKVPIKKEENDQKRTVKKSSSLIHKSDLSNLDSAFYMKGQSYNRSGSYYHEKSDENLQKYSTKHTKGFKFISDKKNINFESVWVKIHNFAQENETNRKHLSYIFSFSDLFSCLIANIGKQESFNFICYVTALTLVYNQKAANFSQPKNNDFDKLLTLIFDKDYPINTRIYILIILSSLDKYIHQLRHNFRDNIFLINFRKLIYQSKPKLQVWLMITLKRVFGFNSLPYSIYNSTSVYLQICELTYHKSFEVRSSALLAISVFLQSKQHSINKFILKNIIPLFYDISFYVRYHLLIIIIRYLTTFSNGNKDYFQFKNINDFYQKAGFEFTQNIFLKNLEVPDIEECDFVKILNSILLHFNSDPHPSIRDLSNEFRKSNFISSLPRFDSTQCNDILDVSLYDSDIVHFDSESLYQLSSNQIMKTFNKIKTTNNSHMHCEEKVKFENINAKFKEYFPTKKVQFSSIRKAAFHNDSMNMVISSSNGFVFELDNNLTVTSKTKLTEYEISQISTLNSMVLVSSNDGNIHIWNPENSKASVSFKADVNNFQNLLSPQLFSVNNFNSQIVTSRSNNGIYLWDIETQQIVSNWDVSSNISALSIHSNEPQIILAGFENGYITAYDCRQSDSIKILFETNKFKNESIINIVGNNNGSNLMYACTNKGNSLIWNGVTNKTRIIRSESTQDKHIISFDIHPYLPFLLYSDSTDSPYMCRYDGTPLHKFSDIPSNSLITTHPSEPLVGFLSPAIDMLQIYQINSACS